MTKSKRTSTASVAFMIALLSLASLGGGGSGKAWARPASRVQAPRAPAKTDSPSTGSASRVVDAPRVVDSEGALPVSFRDLASFEYDLPEAKIVPGKKKPDIPDSVRAWSGKKVKIEGYMIPLKFGAGKVTEFLLSSQPFGCCFGGIPMVNEMVEVVMPKGQGAPSIPDRLITVRGTLTVGEKTDAMGYLLSIYQIKAEAVEDRVKASHHATGGGY